MEPATAGGSVSGAEKLLWRLSTEDLALRPEVDMLSFLFSK
jgi:hypothetical protein